MNVRFGDFRLDGETRQLLEGDAEVHLSPKAFELLRMLLEARPKALSKANLTEQLWPSTFVSETNLSVLIAEIRAVLKDEPRTPRFVRTVHRFGYAFCGTAVDVASASVVQSSGRSYWLMCGTRRISLVEGENVLGRDPKVGAWFDVPGISRHHARIRITNDQTTVEDLGSKNGTFVRGARVTSPTPLHDGEELRLGSMSLTFHVWTPTGTTVSQTTSGVTRTASSRQP